MSRFIDRLKQASQVVSQPMGFRTAQSVSKPRMLLIASLLQADIDGLVDYVAGADAGLLPIAKLSSGAKMLKEIGQAVPDLPWGGWLKSIGRGGIKRIMEVGCDFVVFPAEMSLKILDDEEVGKILAVEASLGEGLLRAVGELPVDAVFIMSQKEGEHFLTWHQLMLFQRFADLLTKPLLVPVLSSVAANELQALWEAGVDGVVVEVAAGQPVGRLKELCQMIDSLTLPLKRKRAKTEALLPYVRGETGIVTEEEEGEE